ncbi:recombinase family protein [Vagococcus fluvialis]|uniref:recombinase family protein n=1 Tax=Vagococcus fluvialis TaxID=2738 RepID=UPI001A8EB946|nr:recombinase family protein [Vagococcus fluvialis]MBO0428369.1 recombinase family protein [Vagococcus fluvialis]
MNRFGYINVENLTEREFQQQLIIMNDFGIEIILYDPNELSYLRKDTELFLYDLSSLDKTILQLEEFFNYLKEKNIRLTFMNDASPLSHLSGDIILPILMELVITERKILSKRTVKGIEEARRKGNIGGRPTISEETIERIKYLYQNQFGSMREIAAECGISLGTAYKYVQSD